MSERTVLSNGIELWTESFGDPAQSPLLLIMGAYFQGIAWPEEFCRQLADAGHFVIRYDNRDVGQSTTIDFEEAPYTLHDMAADAIGILDAYGLPRAHVVGASMGGMIAQEIALSFPERVLTVTSLMSTPLGKSFATNTGGPDLPGPTEVAWEAFAAVPPPGSTASRDAWIEGWTTFARVVTGTITPFDEQRQRRLQTSVVDRARDLNAMWNHLAATAASPDRTQRLGGMEAPTLVVHGTLDPVIPVVHGEATAAAIPGARLVIVDGLGHEFDPVALEPVAAAIIEHAADH